MRSQRESRDAVFPRPISKSQLSVAGGQMFREGLTTIKPMMMMVVVIVDRVLNSLEMTQGAPKRQSLRTDETLAPKCSKWPDLKARTDIVDIAMVGQDTQCIFSSRCPEKYNHHRPGDPQVRVFEFDRLATDAGNIALKSPFLSCPCRWQFWRPLLG